MSGTYDPRITAYFGDAVLQAGFMPLPHLFLRHYRSLGLSQVQAMFVLQLMEIAWDLGDPPNTASKIAARMGLSQRSVRACSKEVHDLGLIEIYDQWDDAGAQVENAYDLGPLFRRLAALVPAHVPTGQQRIRRQRESTSPPVQKPTVSPMQETAASPLQHSSSPPAQEISRGTGKDRAAPLRPDDHRPDESTITGPLQKGSELNKETKKQSKKTTRKQQEHHGGGVQLHITAEETNGFSLRSNVAISADDVERSRAVLDRAGLHTLVAERAAPTLTPAECWSLVCYARGARLGPAWIATQVYDWTRRQPQAPQLNRRYDDAGRLLAALPMEQSERMLDITDEMCPLSAEQWKTSADKLRAELPSEDAEVATRALDAVWAVMAEQRHSTASATPIHDPAPHPTPPTNVHAEEWSAVLQSLQASVPYHDWRSWLAPLELLELDRDIAVIGAPNVFVRNEVSSTYTSLIADALRATFGRDLKVEVVIGTMVLG